RLAPAFEGHDIAYVTTDPGHRAELPGIRVHTVRDASRTDKAALVQCALRIAWIVARERPSVVISTGAAPGYLALRVAKLTGASTMWIDSLANVEELSMPAGLASTTADRCLTQWPHLAEGPVRYEGAVL